MRFVTLNVRSVYMHGRFAQGGKWRKDLMRGQEVRWDGGGTEPAGEYTFSYVKGNENHELGTGFLRA
jgi:hypothetical protein